MKAIHERSRINSMEKLIKVQVFVGLFLSLFLSNIAYSQIGITTGEKIETYKVNSGNGFDTGGKGGSALEQLENMTGRKVTNTRTTAPRTTAPTNVARTISSRQAFENSMKMELASGIASALIGMIFSSGNSQNSQQAIEAQRQQAILLAERAEAERLHNEAIAQAKYDEMMKSYKLLNDPNGLKIKTLSTGDLQFKPLDYKSAPLTMEERQIQNIRNHVGKDGKPLSVTWNFNEWANISAGSNLIEETNTQEESEEDKHLNDVISKHESDDGGRAAAAAGRFGKHFKNETMSYLNEVKNAFRKGDMSTMMEVGTRDPAKIVSNSIKGAVVETKNAAIAEGKEFATKFLTDKNMAIVQDGVVDFFQGDIPEAWKMPLRPN